MRHGRASVTGPGGRIAFKAHGFDLLEAAFEAWRGAGAGAVLVGYLGYELGGESSLSLLPRWMTSGSPIFT